MEIIKPSLIEPGTKYFLKESLKICNKNKMKLNNNVINLSLFLGFCTLFGIFLLYKYNNKPDEEEKRKKEELKKNYLLSKIKMINEKHQEKLDKMITNLPKFESNFEMLHKKFY